jgi:hypothetical protein
MLIRHGDCDGVEWSYPSQGEQAMEVLLLTPILAAAGWSFLYLLLGGGLGGAILIFIVLKMIGH